MINKETKSHMETKEGNNQSENMCQIENIKELGCEDPTLKIKQFLGTALKMIGIFLFFQKIQEYKTAKAFSIKEDLKDTRSRPASDLKPGDIIRIRTKEHIQKTLDKNNKFEGCYFMYEMWQYCGSQHKVLKRVDYFFDERESRLLKAHNVVLLEGVYCPGYRGVLLPKCDRNCYLFWKEVWLEKVE
jgi:hypothetical protein